MNFELCVCKQWEGGGDAHMSNVLVYFKNDLSRKRNGAS